MYLYEKYVNTLYLFSIIYAGWSEFRVIKITEMTLKMYVNSTNIVARNFDHAVYKVNARGISVTTE